MKYPYYVEYMEWGSPIVRLPDELGWVTVFLSDVQEPLGREYFLKDIERVLQGEIPFLEVSTEICGLEIRPDFTTIMNIIEDPDEKDPSDDKCIIETEALRDLLLMSLALKRKKRLKYRYHIEFTWFGLPIMRLPKELEGVTRFLFSEMDDPQESASHLENIDYVLQGKDTFVRGKGKAYCLEIRKDFTTVIDMVAEIKKDAPNDLGYTWRLPHSTPLGVGYSPTSKNSCEIDTEELKKLMLIWLELKKHLSDQERALSAVPPALPVQNIHFAPRHMSVEQKSEVLV